MILFEGMRFIHILAGFLALTTFWIPLITKKGGKIHTRVGWVYTIAMAIVSISAFYMGFYRIFFDTTISDMEVAFSWFLIFIGLLSAATAWYGIRVLRFKQKNKGHRAVIDLLIPSLLVIGGLAVSIYGHIIAFPLLAWFPLTGIFLGASHLSYWLSKPKMRMQWWIEHLVGMLSCSIATITAFTVFGAPRLLQIESINPILWFIPTFVIVPLIIILSLYYMKKFQTKQSVER